MKCSEAVVGRKVIYTPFQGCQPKDKEEGVITSVSNKTQIVFVRYGDEFQSKATNPRDIEYI